MQNRKIFLDTNVVLDILDKKRPNNLNVHILLKKLIEDDIQIVVSEDMLTTIFYISKQKKATLDFFNFIIKDWIISPFGINIVQKAINLSLEKNLDFEDVLQCLCAQENDCDVLITNDNKFYDCGVSIYTIEEFLNSHYKAISSC